MRLKYHRYRPVPPRKTLKQLTAAATDPDWGEIAQYYSRFFLERDDEISRFQAGWAMTEIAWLGDMTEPIRMELRDVFCLKFAVADLERELPDLALKKGDYCYEFPVDPETYLNGRVLTAMLVNNGGKKGNVSCVMQFSDGHVTSHFLTARQITEDANKAVQLPKSKRVKDVSAVQTILVNHRLQNILIYHLCNGPEVWSEFWNEHYADRFVDQEEDDAADWWKKT